MRRAPRGANFGNVRIERPSALGQRERAAWLAASGHQAHWIAVDCVAAAALLIVLTGHAAGQQPQFGVPGWLAVAASAVTALPIAVRRVWPDAVFAITLTANTLATASGVSGNPAVPVAIALYTVAASRSGRRSVTALAVALALTLPAQAWPALDGHPPLARQVLEYQLTATTALLGAAWAVGAMQRRYAARAAAELARRAVMDERLRIAREFHDVISHSMTLITAKAAVTNYVAGSGPEEMRAALEVIEQTGRGALAELRRMLAVLRTSEGGGDCVTAHGGFIVGEAGTARVPAPGLTGLAALAAQSTAAGVRTSLDITGDGEITEAMALSVYRIVQEALTNVVKHAGPARCAVRVDLAGDQVAVEISDDGRPAASGTHQADGHGLIGMRERVGLYGGDFSAGPRPEGGFRVAARLPTRPPRSATSSSGHAPDG
jgi:signal transduction histidine kinase